MTECENCWWKKFISCVFFNFKRIWNVHRSSYYTFKKGVNLSALIKAIRQVDPKALALTNLTTGPELLEAFLFDI
ncbi:hypothetical protein D918_07673 [Trichuris suis]|nr:hypothetical protein D918_07673 [Trichuris suis]